MNLLTSTERQARDYLGTLEQTAKRLDREASIRREISAGTQEAFRWGRVSRRDAHYQPAQRSGDAAIYESQDLMHRRVRSEKLNNAQVKRIIEALVDLTVGCGVQTFADPFDPLLDITALERENLDDYIRYALESDDRYEEWFQDEKRFDASEKMSGPVMHRMALNECIEVGDAILLRCRRARPSGQVSLCWQLLERDQLDNTKDRPAGPGQNKIINGIELDAMGREVAFHVYDAHPYDDFAGSGVSGKSTRILADRVIHLFAFHRPSQNIGVSWLHAIGQNNFDRDKFIGAELQSAAKAALLLLVAKLKHFSGNLGISDDEETVDAYGNQEFKMGSTPHAIRIGQQDEIDIVETNRPTSTLDPFINILDHDTAGGAGISFYTLTGRYDATNFSSVRAAKLDEDLHIRPIQNWLSGRMVLPIRREFNAEAVSRGIVKSVKPADFLANPSRFQRFDALGPGRDLLDPEAETNAAAGRCRAAFSTLKIECARRGLHWIRVLRQKALENRLAELLGVIVDFSKGQGGQVDKTSSQDDRQPAKKKAGAR